MDAISYSYADKQAKRIKKIINDPDSTSGIVTVPKVIASGDSVTVPAGRVAILPNVHINGTLNVQGEVFVPSGATTDKMIPKVTSTDNAVVRFDGTTGEVQNSGVIINDNGNVGIGTSSPITKLHITSDSSSLPAGSAQFILSGDANKERIFIRSSVGGAVVNVSNCSGTISSPTPVSGRMFLGSYQFGGYAGSTTLWSRGAQIAGFASGNWTDTSVPGDIVFMTVPTGSTILTERMRIDSSGNVLVTGSGGLGYGTGAGGTVTQLTSKSTAVILNKPTGTITLANTALAQNVKVAFLFYNSVIGSNDNIILSVVDGSYLLAQYEARGRCAGGVAEIVISHTYGGTLSEAVVLKYDILKGANS